MQPQHSFLFIRLICLRTVDFNGSNISPLIAHVCCGTVISCTVPTHTLFETKFILTGAACEQEKYVKMQEQEKRNLEKEINSFKFEANKQRKFVASLEKDRDRWGYRFLIIHILNYPFEKYIVSVQWKIHLLVCTAALYPKILMPENLIKKFKFFFYL
jgi:hypothetical protein